MAERHLTDSGLPPCPQMCVLTISSELIVSAHISKAEGQWMGVGGEETNEYHRELNERSGVRNTGRQRRSYLLSFKLNVQVELCLPRPVNDMSHMMTGGVSSSY